MGNKICFAVPTFPGHYLYALNFMKSFSEYRYDQQADLFFIFTSPEERDGFMPCNSIVLPKSLRIMKNRGIINIKKIYALMQLKDRYDYIITLDDDGLFCRTADLLEICRSFFQQKVLYGNFVENPGWDFPHIVPDNCRRFFDKNTQEKLHCPLWLWFNQLPIYKARDLKEFFKRTHMGSKIHQLTYNDFDHYIYMFYLMAFKNFDIIDMGITADIGCMEITSQSSFKMEYDIDRNNIFMSTEFAREKLHLPNVMFLCHCDREIRKPDTSNAGKIPKLFTAVSTYFKIKKLLL